MSVRVEFRRAATDDIEDAVDWYEGQKSGLGLEFLHEVHAALQRLLERPELYSPLHRDVRHCATRRFPFNIYFRLRAETIVVVAVFHARRDPRKWRGRA
jgi:plasmid stabilization system protein ParE